MANKVTRKADPLVDGTELALPADGYGRTVVLKPTRDVDTYVVLNADGSSRFALSWPAGTKSPAEAYDVIHTHLNGEFVRPDGTVRPEYERPAAVNIKTVEAAVRAKS